MAPASAEAGAQGTLHVEVNWGEAAKLHMDTSAGIAIRRGSLVQELFLVAPNAALPAVIFQAACIREGAGLPRVHVLTQTDADVVHVLANADLATDADVSVLGIRHEIRSATARLAGPFRRVALHKLDRYLRTKQAGLDLAGEYVNSLYDACPDIVLRSCFHTPC
jgi:hypothetical protein